MREEHRQKQPVTLTREELYAQVWQTPMSRLADQYGISGNGLSKICRRFDIPYPPRGYWAKKTAGKKVEIIALPPVRGRAPGSITIGRASRNLPNSEVSVDLRKKVDSVREDAANVKVPDRLVRPHSIIARWLANYEHRKRDARHGHNSWARDLVKQEAFTPCDRRQHRILNALFKALESIGAKIEQDERQKLFAELDGEKIEFQIREKLKQVKRPLTKQEKRWRLSGEKDWKQELQPTGKLAFAIKTYFPRGLRTEWLETDEKPMEILLPDIIASFVVAGPFLTEQTKKRREIERQRHIAEQKRHEEQQQRRRDENRWRRFLEIAQQWKDAELAREFLLNVNKESLDFERDISGTSLGEWIAWAEQRVQEHDPLLGNVEEIFGLIASVTEWTHYGQDR